MLKLRFKRFAAVAAVLALIAAAAACSSDETDSATDAPLKIFMSEGQTGLLAPSAKAVIRGAEAAVKHLNDNGGLHDRQIEISVKDNQSDPTRGVTLVQDAINETKPDLVIPGVSSNEALAVAPLLGRSEVVGISPASSNALNDPEKYPYFFGQSALQKHHLEAVATFLSKKGDVDKVAFVGPDDALGDAIGDELGGAFDDADIDYTDHRFKADAVDVAPAFQAALADNPDWIYMDAAGTQAGTLLASRVKAGAEDIPAIAGVVMGSQPLLELAGDTNQMNKVSLINLPTQSWVEPEDRSDQFNAFIKGIKAQGEIETTLSTYGAGWDSVMLWADAVKQVKGGISPQKVRKQLMNLSTDHDRLFYRVTFTEKSNFPHAQPDELVIGEPTGVKDGMFTLK